MTDYKKEISADEILKTFNKYKVYYGETGGVTFSGGEPLLQSDFLLETINLLNKSYLMVLHLTLIVLKLILKIN
jgi:pyruvate-formate lyase-activating enzyme